MGNSSKGSQKPYYVDYRMTVHYGIAHGPVDALMGIYVKERDAWPGMTVYNEAEENQQQNIPNVDSFKDMIASLTGGQIVPNSTLSVATGPTAIRINRPDLFGGNEKEGGAVGEAYWLPGREDQVMPAHIASRYGLTPSTMVGYRGLASVFFSAGGARGGFLWSQNNPYLNPAWFTVFRASRGLDTSKQTIQVENYPADTNAINIIYEALTNDDWGMGAPETIMKMPSFMAAQATIFDERFGLSLVWTNQTTIEAFITEILDHIQATLFVDPADGLLTIKLIRDDYDVETLPRFGPHNADLNSRSRKLWGETINEINISFTNPKNEKSETLTFQDPANIAMQGGEIISETRDYYGIRNPLLATAVGARDIRSACQPLFSAEMETDRSGWKMTPGQCLILDWPEDGLTGMVMRIMNVDYGRPGEPAIKVSLLEDIFSLQTAEWSTPPVTEWTDPRSEPSVADAAEIVTIPYALIARSGILAAVEGTLDEQYPRVIPAILASSDDYDTYSIAVHGPRVLPNGETEQTQVTSFYPTSRGELTQAMPKQAQTLFTQAQLGELLSLTGPEVSSFAMIGTGGDAEMELVMFDSYNPNTGVWTIARGVLDTVPRAWPLGTPVWYLENYGVDTNERLAGTTISYRILPRTSVGELPLALSPVYSKLLTARPYLPMRPAAVTIGGVGIDGPSELRRTTKADILVTWAHRNRLMEDTVIRRWNEGSVTPEAGQTTRIEVLNELGEILATYPGLTGTSFTVPYAASGGWRRPRIRVRSERDGFLSLQGVEMTVLYDLFGYGNNYGMDYGQNDG